MTTTLQMIECPECLGSGETYPGIDPQVSVPCGRCGERCEVPLETVTEGEIAAHFCPRDRHCDLCCLSELAQLRDQLAKATAWGDYPAGNRRMALNRLRSTIAATESGTCDECPCGCGETDAWKGVK